VIGVGRQQQLTGTQPDTQNARGVGIKYGNITSVLGRGVICRTIKLDKKLLLLKIKKMTMQFFNFFKDKDAKTDLEKALKLGLITYEEKLRLEADRAGRRLDKFIAKTQRKKK
jgi:hypothetical protein